MNKEKKILVFTATYNEKENIEKLILDIKANLPVASILINLAIFLATFTFKLAQKHYSSVFCLLYLQIVWSSLIGFFIFNEILNTMAFIGALFIIISGFISLPGQFKQLHQNE